MRAFILIIFFFWLSSSQGKYQSGDLVIYSRYFSQILGLEEINVFKVLSDNGKMVTIIDTSGKKIRTHQTSLQPIFQWEKIYEDRTILKLIEEYSNQDAVDEIRIRSNDISGLFNDSVCYTGQEYELCFHLNISEDLFLTLTDTFHYKNVGPRFHGVNDGIPDFFILKRGKQTIMEGDINKQPLFYEAFLKVDGLKLLKDETLRLSSTKQDNF